MQPGRQQPVRVLGRLLWLVWASIRAALDFLLRVTLAAPDRKLPARAAWLQRTARRFARIIALQTEVSGPVPVRGLLVSNHLSYLDILVFASLTPAVFVAKREVKAWPLFGWFARLGGTVFVNRARRTDVGAVADEIKSALDRGVVVVLFPEGTSSGGETVLPFKSSLLEPATDRARPLSISFIQYQIEEGVVSEEICYWRDMKMAPHALNILGKSNIRTFVQFAEVSDPSADRKELAVRLRDRILRMKEASCSKI